MHNYPNFIAALRPWTITEPLGGKKKKKKLFHETSFIFPGTHLFSIWPSFLGLVLCLEDSTGDPKHCGHFPTICCYFSFLISMFFNSSPPCSLNLFFSRQQPSVVTCYFMWVEMMERLLQSKQNLELCLGIWNTQNIFLAYHCFTEQVVITTKAVRLAFYKYNK